MKRSSVAGAASILVIAASAALLAGGCGSSSGGNGPGPDGGGQDSSAADSPGTGPDGMSESGPTDGGDGASPQDSGDSGDARGASDAGDGAPPLAAGSLLVEGATLSAYVVTSDGYVAYTNDATGVASAVVLTGGAPQQMATGTAGHMEIARLQSILAPSIPINTAGVAVFTDTIVADGGVANLPFTTWTNTGGSQTWWGPGTTTLDLAGSRNGSRVSWFQLGSSAGHGTLDVSSSTFQQAYTVANNLPNHPGVAFGGVNDTDLIVALPTGVLEAYDTSTGTAKTISSNLPTPVGAQSFLLDSTAMHVAYVDAAGSFWVATAPAYTPTLVSSVAGIQQFPLFSPDGATLYFNDTSGNIYRSPVPIPGTVTVASGALQGLNAVSPDGNWLLASNAYASNPFPEQDVLVISAQATGGTLTAVDSMPHAWQQGFTADSTHVLVGANPSTVSGETGGLPNAPQTTLLAYDIASHTLSSSLSTSMLSTAVAATGTLAVFHDNPRTGSAPGTLLCDLRSVDVGVSSPVSKLIQSDVECGSHLGVGGLPFVPILSADAKTVVYSYQGTAFRPGVYAYMLP